MFDGESQKGVGIFQRRFSLSAVAMQLGSETPSIREDIGNLKRLRPGERLPTFLQSLVRIPQIPEHRTRLGQAKRAWIITVQKHSGVVRLHVQERYAALKMVARRKELSANTEYASQHEVGSEQRKRV